MHWLDDVMEDLRRMDMKRYVKIAVDRRWRRMVSEARTHAEKNMRDVIFYV